MVFYGMVTCMENITLPVPVEHTATLPSATKLFGDAFSFYKSHIKIIAAIGSIPFLFNVIGIIGSNFSALIAVVFQLVSFIAGIFALLAFFVFLRANGNPEGGIKGAYMRGALMMFPYAWVLLLQSLVVAGGFFAFVVPGILFSVLLGQSVYAFVLEDKKGMDALLASWHYVSGNWWGVLWRIFFLGIMIFLIGVMVFFVIGFGLTGGGMPIPTQIPPDPATLTMGVGALRFIQMVSDFLTNVFYMPFSLIYVFLLYQALRNTKSGIALSEEKTMRMQKIIKIFIACAIVGVVTLTIFAGVFLSEFLRHAGDPNYSYPVRTLPFVDKFLQNL